MAGYRKMIYFKDYNTGKQNLPGTRSLELICPSNYAIHGIDVSKYQSMIAWEEVKAMKVKNIQLGICLYKSHRRNWQY